MSLPALAIGAAFLLVAFALIPLGMVELNEAWGWPRWRSGVGHALGNGLMLAAIALAVYCSHLFSRVGKGTPVPVDPPKQLVITGLYRYSRNPIYVAHVALLLGLFLNRGELGLLLYAILYAGVIHAWIVLREEPELRQRFGDEYSRYAGSVPRWIRIRPGRPLPSA